LNCIPRSARHSGRNENKKVVTDRSYYSNIYIYKFGWDIIIKQVGLVIHARTQLGSLLFFHFILIRSPKVAQFPVWLQKNTINKMEKTSYDYTISLREYSCNIQEHANEVFCSFWQRFFDFPSFRRKHSRRTRPPIEYYCFRFVRYRVSNAEWPDFIKSHVAILFARWRNGPVKNRKRVCVATSRLLSADEPFVELWWRERKGPDDESGRDKKQTAVIDSNILLYIGIIIIYFSSDIFYTSHYSLLLLVEIDFKTDFAHWYHVHQKTPKKSIVISNSTFSYLYLIQFT